MRKYQKPVGIVLAMFGVLYFLGTVGSVDQSPITFPKFVALLVSGGVAYVGARMIGSESDL